MELRILLIADTDPELEPDLPTYVATRQIDAVITVGDLDAGLLAGIDRLDVPTMGVYGNHCNGRYLEDLGVTNLHLRSEIVSGISFLGLQGCVRYKRDERDILYTQQEYAEMVTALPRADVVVTHCPPRGINDHDDAAHVGIDALRTWVQRKRPGLLVHGHTYPRKPVTQYGPTRVVYVYGSRELYLARVTANEGARK